jgi:hypothetical protein
LYKLKGRHKQQLQLWLISTKVNPSQKLRPSADLKGSSLKSCMDPPRPFQQYL